MNFNDDKKDRLYIFITISLIAHLLIFYLVPWGGLSGSLASDGSDQRDFEFIQVVDFQPMPDEPEAVEEQEPDLEPEQEPEIENNEEIDDYDKTPVINSINFLKKVVDGSIVDVEQLNFVTNWCLFVFNWNNNVLKDKYLEKDIIYIQRATKQNHTINEVHEILNRLSKEMKKYINSNPPAFEVAKHYINYLEE